MRIGFALPQFGAQALQAEHVTRFAREAEALGAGSLWVADRLFAAVDPSVGYAGTDTVPEEFRTVLDPFALLAAAAAVTDRALLGSSVLNAPWYPPALFARQLTTIDRIGGGRLLVGLGTGWSPEEYRAAGVPMDERGARLDECLDVLDAWWTTDPVEHRGAHWEIPAAHVRLKPARAPRPPLYLAGFAPRAVERIARRADGWLPIAAAGGKFDPEAAVTGPMARIREQARLAGRDPQALDVVLRVNTSAGTTVEDIAGVLRRARDEAGVEHAFVDPMYMTGDVDQCLELCGRVLESVGRG
ncbi:TIGR03619 family F420-dependent LLM class oxidoreductase [Streptomyces thermolineatus]|uniref:TIGR03619 family F420-dependent LLM class oxidoreductase n=1 Tax=Streptomyces thermolineatus TaxID=44033 RepID=A0ABP5ZS92_9ACTN